MLKAQYQDYCKSVFEDAVHCVRFDNDKGASVHFNNLVKLGCTTKPYKDNLYLIDKHGEIISDYNSARVASFC